MINEVYSYRMICLLSTVPNQLSICAKSNYIMSGAMVNLKKYASMVSNMGINNKIYYHWNP